MSSPTTSRHVFVVVTLMQPLDGGALTLPITLSLPCLLVLPSPSVSSHSPLSPLSLLSSPLSLSSSRMLDTKGDTAVYLMFAYARVASILRKVGRVVVVTTGR